VADVRYRQGADVDLDALLPGIVAGDAGAFARWVAAAEPVLRRRLRGFATSVDVECVVQECLLRAWQLAGSIRPDARGNSLLRWSTTVAFNLARQWARRQRAEGMTPGELDALPDDAEAGWIGPAGDVLLRRRIVECMDALGDGRAGQAIRARIDACGGETDEALARRTGMSHAAFRKNVSLARAALTTCLDGFGVKLASDAGRPRTSRRASRDRAAERRRALQLEQTTSAWRARSADGALRFDPAWHDLDGEARVAAADEAYGQRAIEAALDVDGLSTTGRRVLHEVTRER
jgi:DNA-directed RNA polymerase specialized sigma24 family protein